MVVELPIVLKRWIPTLGTQGYTFLTSSNRIYLQVKFSLIVMELFINVVGLCVTHKYFQLFLNSFKRWKFLIDTPTDHLCS